MRIVLGTLCLNEMEWLPTLYEQHKDWPGLVKWVFVEAADRVYAESNPQLVSHDGLSTDGTTEFLWKLSLRDPQVVHVRHGFTGSVTESPAQGKCEARSRYLAEAESVEPDLIGVLDADEFYCRDDQSQVGELVGGLAPYSAFCFRHREIWRPPVLVRRPLFEAEVVGGFWAIPYCRWWRWSPGLRYGRNHNTPQRPDGSLLDDAMIRLDRQPEVGEHRFPQMIHLGFAASLATRQAKHAYYRARGEGRTDKRGWYVASRAAWESWRPGRSLPRRAHVVPYQGPIPEAFRQ